MAAFRSILFSALVASLFTGAIVSVLHVMIAFPVLTRAGALMQAITSNGQLLGGMPEYRGDRDFVLALVLVYFGFALVLASAAEIIRPFDGIRSGLIWGLSGFVVFVLAPSLDLPAQVMCRLPASPCRGKFGGLALFCARRRHP